MALKPILNSFYVDFETNTKRQQSILYNQSRYYLESERYRVQFGLSYCSSKRWNNKNLPFVNVCSGANPGVIICIKRVVGRKGLPGLNLFKSE